MDHIAAPAALALAAQIVADHIAAPAADQLALEPMGQLGAAEPMGQLEPAEQSVSRLC
jgi:hypothetical protein